MMTFQGEIKEWGDGDAEEINLISWKYNIFWRGLGVIIPLIEGNTTGNKN